MSIYLERYAWPQSIFPEYEPQENLEMIVVIPAFNEGNINAAIRSLDDCKDKEKVLLMVIVNEAEDAEESIQNANQATIDGLSGEDFEIAMLYERLQLPPKKAGVGLARKIGMDQAVRIFETLKKDGIIICFDADCICEQNYFQAIDDFYADSGFQLGLIHHEHVLDGTNIDAIVNYELFLRYYINALRWAGFPYAFQTLGSCITVKSKAYQKQGGMNTRKAGEDFYFIHKMTPLGGIGEINATTIYPSDRVSDRVPFGTGHAIQKHIDKGDPNDHYEAYNPRTFTELRYVFSNVALLYDCQNMHAMGYSNLIKDFLLEQKFEAALTKIIDQSPSLKIFQDRFNAWFDAFRVLKYVHFSRDNYYPNIEIIDAIGWINHQYLRLNGFDGTKENKLIAIREADRQANFTTSGQGY